MEYAFYNTFSSPFDTFTIVWKEIGSNVKLERIFISNPKIKSEVKAFQSFNKIKLGSSQLINIIAGKIQRFLKGENIHFNLGIIDFTKCYELQKKILLAEYSIPRGWISTYKRIANHLGINNGARVVGNALAKNPFPIIIPCHRAIKTNGELGGFQGGVNMKRALLMLEDLKFSPKGNVIMEKIFF
jgi:methylated-DNA-[protein]-cysteine S-methyltransferase